MQITFNTQFLIKFTHEPHGPSMIIFTNLKFSINMYNFICIFFYTYYITLKLEKSGGYFFD